MIANNRFFLFLLCIVFSFFFLFSCTSSLSNNSKIQILSSSYEDTFWNENIVLKVASEDETFNKVQWTVNGIVQETHSNYFKFNTGTVEQRYIINALVTRENCIIESDPFCIYNTKNKRLLETCYSYIDKNDINIATSIAIYNSDYCFNFNYGKTSIDSQINCTDETLFYYYSITKIFISALILDFEEQGKIHLSDKISDFFEESYFDTTKININATIEQLLTHRSGIGEYTSNYKIFLNNPFLYEEWNPSRILDFINTTVNTDGSYCYSTANYIILGLIIERVSNLKLNELLRQFYLNKLGLNKVKLCPQDAIDFEKLAHPHVLPNTELFISFQKTPYDIVNYFGNNTLLLVGESSWAGGGLVGDSISAAKWIYELFSMKGSAVSDSVRSKIIESTSLSFSGCDELDSFGLCGRRIFYNDDYFLGSYGRSIGSNNLAFYNPKKDLGFCILTSTNADKNGNPDIFELLSLLYDFF